MTLAEFPPFLTITKKKFARRATVLHSQSQMRSGFTRTISIKTFQKLLKNIFMTSNGPAISKLNFWRSLNLSKWLRRPWKMILHTTQPEQMWSLPSGYPKEPIRRCQSLPRRKASGPSIWPLRANTSVKSQCLSDSWSITGLDNTTTNLASSNSSKKCTSHGSTGSWVRRCLEPNLIPKIL